MAQKQGLEIFSANGTKILDLTTRLSKYLGEVDVYPTSPSDECSGVLPTSADIEQFGPRMYCVVKKVYVSNMNLSGNVYYALPEVFYTRVDGRYQIRWSYIRNTAYNQQINLPVRIGYGFF